MTVPAQHADRGGQCQGKPGHMGRGVQQDVRADRRRVRQAAGAAAVGPGLPAELADAVATSKARRARRREIWVEQACGKYFLFYLFSSSCRWERKMTTVTERVDTRMM